MSLGKKDIAKNISSKTQLSLLDSSKILEIFILFLKKNKSNKVKISSFGTFSSFRTPERVGRNPKTKENFEIQSRLKLKFNSSNKIKTFLNY